MTSIIGRRSVIAAAAFVLLLGGCQTPRRMSPWTREQETVLRSEGFVSTERGWEFSVQDKLLFATDESRVEPAQEVIINRIAGQLLAVGISRATVEGHADDTGSIRHNERLSQQRAESVALVLEKAGFAPSSVRRIGLGARYPVDTNETDEGRRENRRVVILIPTP